MPIKKKVHPKAKKVEPKKVEKKQPEKPKAVVPKPVEKPEPVAEQAIAPESTIEPVIVEDPQPPAPEPPRQIVQSQTVVRS